jgi:hypothetical protein
VFVPFGPFPTPRPSRREGSPQPAAHAGFFVSGFRHLFPSRLQPGSIRLLTRDPSVTRTLLLALLAAVSTACSGGGSSSGPPPDPPTQPPAPTVSTVSVTADSSSVVVGTTLQMTAQARTAAGTVMTGQTFSWSSSAPAVATVSAGGVLTAVAPGTAAISATVGTVTGTMNVTVRAVPVAAVAIIPSVDSIQAGLARQLVVRVTAADGSVLAGRTVTYTSSNQNALSVLSTGVMAGLTAGTSTVTATVEGVSGTATVKVLPRPAASVTAVYGAAVVLVGSQVQLQAQATDATGQPVTQPALQWTSSNPGVATVAADGTVRGVARGWTKITVASGTVNTWVDVGVLPAPAAGQGILQATATVPERGGTRPETGRIVFVASGGGLALPTARQAGRDGGQSRLTRGIVQFAVPAGTGYTVRAVSQGYRYPLQRIAGGTGVQTGVAVTAGQVTQVTVPLAVPHLQLTGPASVAGGAQATFAWTVTAPGLASSASLEAGLILEERNTSSSSFPFGGDRKNVFATHANGVAQGTVTFLASQTPGQFKVRAFVTGDTWSVVEPAGGVFGTRFHAFGPLETERILTIQ